MKKALFFGSIIFSVMISFYLFSGLRGIKVDDEIMEYERVSNKALLHAAQKIMKEQDVHGIGFGGGKRRSGERFLTLALEADRLASLEEARKLVVDCVEIFLQSLNNEEELRPFFEKYPLSVENIRLEIFFRYEKGYSVRPPNISVASCDARNIEYRIKPDELLEDFHEETFEEALQHLKK